MHEAGTASIGQGTHRPMRRRRCHSHLVVAVLVATLLVVPVDARAGDKRPFGDARVLARFPYPPGFPEGVARQGNVFYVAGPATFGTTAQPPSAVVAFDLRTGEKLETYDAPEEDLSQEHANSSIAFDGDGRLYVLNTQIGIYRLDPKSGAQERYALRFPDLEPCPPATAGTGCSPTPHNAPPIPNDIAFDADGNAYVTDSTQATIWLIPAAGPKPATPQVWYQHTSLASEYIGVNGIRFNPQRTRLYLTVSTDLHGRSFVYTLPFAGADPPPGDVAPSPFFEYPEGTLPDGIAFGQSGLLYVALANPRSSGISILEQAQPGPRGEPRGHEYRTLGNDAASPTYPYDSPANMAFTPHRSILVTNHAIATGFVDPGQFTVLDVFVDDLGAPLEKPKLP